ncbi:hybrid sensor histidine kinase/response regulator [Pseudoduganella lutea]|uniref:histidine kinase n=1 Tax=Pseudoduganella lutea TaxID=321985 RepID=A0A4P6L491_9BURK|nr:ATP-binding protein [Pseudoduganella lutea]QBE66411.1 response regulator [Pseudoduganella lutea]
MLTPDFAFLDHAGSAGRQIAQNDWSTHPLGPITGWPPALRTALSMMLSSGFPSYVAWTDRLHTLFNEPYSELMAERPNALQGMSIGALWPEVADAVVSICSQAFAGETMFFQDMSLPVTRSGCTGPNFFTFSVSPIRDHQGEICGVLGTVIETTEKVLALARHREAEERYRLSLEAGRMGTWSVDPDTGVTIMDERFASLFGVTPDVAEQGARLEYFTQIIHPDDRDNVIAAVSQAMQNDAAYDIDYRTVPKIGRTVWVSVKGRMFTDVQSGKRRFAGVATDITSRKEAELALRNADRRKDEFLAMLAHELRNPLAPISAAASILRMRTLDPKHVAVTSEVISRQVAHMTNLIDDLLDVSRVTRGLVTLAIAEEPLGGIINDAIEQATPLMRAKGQRITLQLAAEPVVVCGDKKRLVQALSNILNNATKYTPDGGHILLATTFKAARVQIDVTDTGVGMDPNFTSRAFELFSQAERSSDRASGGLGLGLALVKSLVELHQGTVSAFSAGIGKGSTFSLILPCLLEREVKPDSTLYDDAAHRGMPSLRIMIVDDNQDAALMMAMLLEAASHEVIVKHSAKAALEHFAVARPDVFLLDIGLPEMDGNTLARHLRAQPETANAVLIAVTGYGQEHDRKATQAAGFNHHLVKPLDSDHLLRLLADIAQANSWH